MFSCSHRPKYRFRQKNVNNWLNLNIFRERIIYGNSGTTQSETTYGNGQKVKKYYDKFDRLIKVSDDTGDETVLVQYIYNDEEIDSENFDAATFSPTVSANSPLRVVVDRFADTTTWYTYDQFGQLIISALLKVFEWTANKKAYKLPCKPFNLLLFHFNKVARYIPGLK